MGFKEGGECSIFKEEPDKSFGSGLCRYWLTGSCTKTPISLSGLLKKLYFCRGGSAWSVIHLAYCQHRQKYFFKRET